jgi:pyrimidine operon attenuation protein/uracil phosphoribosyltransferase
LDRTSVQEHSKVLTPDGIDRSLRRISHEILETNAPDLGRLALVGVLTRGAPLARRISENIRLFEGIEVPVGSLDITLHRDDLVDEEPEVKGSHMPFEVLKETDGEDGVIVVGA